MSYNLHYAKSYHPDWQLALGDPEAWDALYFAKFRDEDDSWNNEGNSEFEVSGETFRKYIKELLKDPTKQNEFYKESTNAELAQDLTNIVEGCQDEIVHMEWF